VAACWERDKFGGALAVDHACCTGSAALRAQREAALQTAGLLPTLAACRRGASWGESVVELGFSGQLHLRTVRAAPAASVVCLVLRLT
jgi:hypothetical protein